MATPPPLPFVRSAISEAASKKNGLTWHGHDRTLTVAGVKIPGMLYTSAARLNWPGEPSALNLSKTVARTSADPAADLGYYCSYEEIDGHQRRCYLQWLAAGRTDEEPSLRSLGYVFLFFYGLERRMLVDNDYDPHYLAEITRLLQVYGAAHKSRSIRSYFVQLLHWGSWRQGIESYRNLWPGILDFDDHRPNETGLQFVLANLHQRGEPMDFAIAARLGLANDACRRGVVLQRAQQEFWTLFQSRFADAYPDGMPLDAARHEASIEYRPSSAALLQMTWEGRSAKPFQQRIPNVLGVHKQFTKLPQIWNSCIDDLSGYSRARGSKKQGVAAGWSAWQALPVDIRAMQDHPLREGFNDLIGRAPQEANCSIATVGDLASLLEITERPKLSTTQARQVVEMLEGLNCCLAPDPHLTGMPLSWTQEVALYQSVGKPKPHVAGLLRLLYFAVALGASDGELTDDEMEAFHQLVAPELKDESDAVYLLTTETALRRDTNVAVRAVSQMAKLIPTAGRKPLLQLVCKLAGIDGDVSLNETAMLRRMSRALQQPQEVMRSFLEQEEVLQPGSGSQTDEGGERIPRRAVGVTLDFARINELKHETHEVISMLAVVMNDDAPVNELASAPTITDATPAGEESPDWMEGLEVRFHGLLLSVVGTDDMTNDEFTSLAKKYHLLVDDVFNAVNAWADEALGDFLLERGDDIIVHRQLLPAEAITAQA